MKETRDPLPWPLCIAAWCILILTSWAIAAGVGYVIAKAINVLRALFL